MAIQTTMMGAPAPAWWRLATSAPVEPWMPLTPVHPSVVAMASVPRLATTAFGVTNQTPKTATTAILQQMMVALPRALLRLDTNAREAPPPVQTLALSNAVTGRSEVARPATMATLQTVTVATRVVLSKLTMNVSVVTRRPLIAAELYVATAN